MHHPSDMLDLLYLARCDRVCNALLSGSPALMTRSAIVCCLLMSAQSVAITGIACDYRYRPVRRMRLQVLQLGRDYKYRPVRRMRLQVLLATAGGRHKTSTIATSMGQPNLLRRIAAFRSSTGPDPPRCIRYFSFSFSFGFNLSLSFCFYL